MRNGLKTLDLLIVAGLGFAVIGGLAMLSATTTLGNIKSRPLATVAALLAGQQSEYAKPLRLLPFEVASWREGRTCPQSKDLYSAAGKKGKVTALVDSDDIHCLMIGASGVGKTAYFLYPKSSNTPVQVG